MKRLRSIRLRGEVFQQIADGWQTQLRFPTDGERPWDVAADGGRFQVSARISRETHRMGLRVVSLRTERLQRHGYPVKRRGLQQHAFPARRVRLRVGQELARV